MLTFIEKCRIAMTMDSRAYYLPKFAEYRNLSFIM